jgi:hypothetical protein
LASRTSRPRASGQVLAERAAVQIDRVGIAHHARGRRDRTGRTDADRAAAAGLLLDLGDQVADGLDRRVIGARIGSPNPRQIGALGVQGGGLDLGPAEINADLNHQ